MHRTASHLLERFHVTDQALGMLVARAKAVVGVLLFEFRVIVGGPFGKRAANHVVIEVDVELRLVDGASTVRCCAPLLLLNGRSTGLEGLQLVCLALKG
jgi:hypothetical protein